MRAGPPANRPQSKERSKSHRAEILCRYTAGLGQWRWHRRSKWLAVRCQWFVRPTLVPEDSDVTQRSDILCHIPYPRFEPENRRVTFGLTAPHFRRTDAPADTCLRLEREACLGRRGYQAVPRNVRPATIVSLNDHDQAVGGTSGHRKVVRLSDAVAVFRGD